jgi:hypothetical protein
LPKKLSPWKNDLVSNPDSPSLHDIAKFGYCTSTGLFKGEQRLYLLVCANQSSITIQEVDALVIPTVAAGSQERKPAAAESEPQETIQEVSQEELGGASPGRVAEHLPQA